MMPLTVSPSPGEGYNPQYVKSSFLALVSGSLWGRQVGHGLSTKLYLYSQSKRKTSSTYLKYLLYSAYLFITFPIFNVKLKTTDLSRYYAYVVNCVFSLPPLNSSLAVPAGSVTLSHWLFGLWHDAKPEWFLGH